MGSLRSAPAPKSAAYVRRVPGESEAWTMNEELSSGRKCWKMQENKLDAKRGGPAEYLVVVVATETRWMALALTPVEIFPERAT